MKRRVRFATGAAGMVAALVAAGSAYALPLTFGVSGTNKAPASAPAESVTFDVFGTSVIVTLTDTPGKQANPETLTAPFSSGNPILPGAGNAEPVYDGNHERATCDAISGWVWNPQQPDAPIAVSIYDDQTLLVTVTANQFRQDLLDAHIGNGSHGFTNRRLPLLKDGKPHQIRVMVAGSDFELANTPKVINCAPDPDSK